MDRVSASPAFDAPTDAPTPRFAHIRRPALRTVPRHDLYRHVHAGLRACMGEALAAVARMDADDPSDVMAIAVRMQELIAMFSAHLANEDAFVHPAMEARRPGSTARFAHDHAEHVAGFGCLARDLAALRNAAAADRPFAADALHRDLAAFVADNLIHMAAEERDCNAVLWATHTDAELAALQAVIIGSIPPQKTPAYLRWIVPALPPCARLAMMRDLRRAALPGVFDATLALIQPYLSDREWLKLMGGLTA